MCNIIKKPLECSKKEKEDFYDLVVKCDEVDKNGLKERIEGAKLLAFHYENINLVGTAALKCPDEDYKKDKFKRAGVAEQSDNYNLEFGWACTEEKYRRKGIGSGLIQQILNCEGSQCIYATTKERNNKMQNILEEKGFKKIGNHFLSSKGHYLLLFTRAIIS